MIGEMIFESLGVLLVAQGTACLALGLAASCVLRHRAARAHQALLTALLASVLMPSLYLAAGHWELGLLASRTTPPAQEATETQPLDIPPPTTALAYEPGPPVIGEPVAEDPAYDAATTRVPWGIIGLACWIAATATLLIRLVLRFILGLHVVHMARPLESERLCRAIETAKSKLGISGSVDVRCSKEVRSPVIWCWGTRPVLLVHESASHCRDNTDWVGVFCHELSHWKRLDHISGLFAEVLAAVFPWHPFVWWTRGRLLKLSEQVCDDWVVASGQIGLDYAQSLLDLAPAGQAAFVPTIVGKEKAMKERIRRIVRNECDNPRIGVRWAMGVSALAVLASVGAALAQQRPAAPERREDGQQPQVRQEQAAQRPAVAGRRNVLTRLRDQLQQQARDTEAAIRQRGDDAGPEGRILHAELDALHEQIQLVEQQLRDLEGGPRRAGQARTRPAQPQAQPENLRQRRAELTEESRLIEERIKGLGPDQDQEARELRVRLQAIRAQMAELNNRPEGLPRVQGRVERAGAPAAPRPRTAPAENPRLEAQVEELRNQMRELREQMQQMQRLMEQAGARGQTRERAGEQR